MYDPLGFMVLEAREGTGIRVAGGDFDPAWPEDPRPCIVLVRSTPSRSPFGRPGNSRLGLQELLVIGRCYGAPDAEAEEQGDNRVAQRDSARVAGALSDVFHDKGPRRDASGRLLLMTDSVTGGGPAEDPDTRWPYEIVTLRVLAPAQSTAA